MAEQLCIASWNATGIMSSASYINSLFDKRHIHILGLSEHWLFNHNLHFLDSINSNYVGFGIADNDLLLNSNRQVVREALQYCGVVLYLTIYHPLILTVTEFVV